MRKFIIRTSGKPLLRSILGCTLAITILGSAIAATQLEIQSVPMLKLTGEVGTTNQIQYVTELGQTNAWNVLTNIVLTNSPQFYVDTSATGTVKRFYQAVVMGGTNANIPDGMALIPAGEFTMGDAMGDTLVYVNDPHVIYPPLPSNELPTRSVNVSAFSMDKTLVTKALWDQVNNWAKAHGYTFDNGGSGKAGNHPIQMLSWYDAVKWCNARSEMESRTPAYYTSADQSTVYRSGQVAVQNDWVKWNAGYRLPTEAEWEKGARGGLSGKRFPWGDTISHTQANYYSDSAYSYDISLSSGYHTTYNDGVSPYTSPVGSFAPNGYGLYDMAGNLLELCWDWYVFDVSGSQSDPHGPDLGSGRILRGGQWGNNADICRVSSRSGIPSDFVSSTIGFRSVLPAGQ
jgi:formylglycine-generating enzyme required for sulfatase activity